MKWTKEQPTKVGYYWHRRDMGDAEIVHVWRDYGGEWQWVPAGRERPKPVHDVDPRVQDEWSGPLSEPE